jgi:hypothetical protein
MAVHDGGRNGNVTDRNMSGVLDSLGQMMATGVMPALATAGVVETMSVSRTARTSDGAGGYTPGTTTTPYTSVPVAVEIDRKGQRYDTNGKLIAQQTYILTFPTQTAAGSLISIALDTDLLIVNARSPLPARTYRIIAPADDAGVVNAFVCVREN